MVDSFDVFASAGCASAHGKRFDKVPSKNGIIVHLSMQAQHPSMCGFIVEGFPAPKGDGSEFKAIGQPPQQLQLSSPQSPSIPAFRPPAPPQMPVKPPRPAMAMPMQHMPAAPAPPFANAAMQAPPNYAVRRRLAGAGVADSYMGHGSYDFAEEADDESYST